MSLELCRVVLVETHYPGNLGATARVMANMGLEELVLVAPIADPNHPQARQMATHGAAVLEGVRVERELGAALADCVLVAGTTARTGGLMRRQPIGTPEVIASLLASELQVRRRVALVFGAEPNGLSNDAVTRCHHLIRIPTALAFPALNLAQAVAICLYELRRACDRLVANPQAGTPDQFASADFAAQEHLYGQLRVALEEIHFLYGPKADALMHAVRHLLGKARLSVMEVKLLLGLARQIRWYVAQHAPIKEARSADLPQGPATP
jgi:tRNA/rRNA methyltransferase